MLQAAEANPAANDAMNKLSIAVRGRLSAPALGSPPLQPMR